MSIVSISKASQLTGKSRTTLHRYMKQGKLSTVRDSVTGAKGIDTSELLRVFGSLGDTGEQVLHNTKNEQGVTLQNETDMLRLKLENEHLREMLKEKDARIDDLNKAMTLLEHKKITFWKRLFNK